MDMTISHFLWLEAGERQLLDKIGHSDVNLKNRNSTTTIRPSNPPSQPPPPRGTNSINVVPPSFRYTTLNLFIRLHHSSFLSHLVFFFFAKIDGARIKSYFGNCDSQLQPRGIPTILQPLSPPSLPPDQSLPLTIYHLVIAYLCTPKATRDQRSWSRIKQLLRPSNNAHYIIVLIDNHCFIQNMIKYQPVYHSLVKTIERVFNLQFTLYIRSPSEVIPNLAVMAVQLQPCAVKRRCTTSLPMAKIVHQWTD